MLAIAETPPMNRLTSVVAVLVAIVFLGMSGWLVYVFQDWQQVAVVYNAICAVAFSAFGVLLGSKVQEVNVNKAVQTARSATTELEKTKEAIKTAANELHRGTTDDDEAGGGTVEPRRANQAALSILINAMN